MGEARIVRGNSGAPFKASGRDTGRPVSVSTDSSSSSWLSKNGTLMRQRWSG